MVEEYDLQSNQLVVRKFRKPTPFGGEGPWEYEIGNAADNKVFNPDMDLIAPSSSNVC